LDSFKENTIKSNGDDGGSRTYLSTAREGKKIYCAQEDFVNLDSARRSKIEAKRSDRRSPAPSGQGEKEDRFGKAAGSPNSQNLTECGIASVISFCTNDIRFFSKCVEACASFSSQLIVPVCDHFYNGIPEHYALLETLYAQYPSVTFLEFAYDPEHLYGTYINLSRDHPHFIHHWHNSSRLIAYYFLKDDIDYVCFCDVDEIIESDRFIEWLNIFPYQEFTALRFSSFWYFREAGYRATTYPNATLMVRKNVLTPALFFNPDERMGMFHAIEGKKQLLVKGLDDRPMLHHYSWVRSKKELIHKVSSWGHHWERNWMELVNEEYSRDFNKKDFVRFYSYEEVEPFFDPLLEERPLSLNSTSLGEHLEKIKVFPHVRRVTAQDIFRKNLIRDFDLCI